SEKETATGTRSNRSTSASARRNPAGGQPATVLTPGKVRCSPCSRCCAWLCSSHPLRCAPWQGDARSGRESRLLSIKLESSVRRDAAETSVAQHGRPSHRQ